MRHMLKIKVSDKRSNDGVIAFRQLCIREKLLRLMLGNPVKLTVLVPGDSVDAVEIHAFGEGGCNAKI